MNRIAPAIPVYLERLDPTQHMARFYWIGIEPTLFEKWTVVCRWGRIGTFGQRQEQWFATCAAATEAAQSVVARKRRRRGYRTHAEWRVAISYATSVSTDELRTTSANRSQYELDLD